MACACLALSHLWQWRYDAALSYADLSLEAERLCDFALGSRPTLMLVQASAGQTEALRQVEKIDLLTVGEVNDLGKITELLFVIEALAVLGEDDAAAKLYPLMSEPLDCMKIACFGALMPETTAGNIGGRRPRMGHCRSSLPYGVSLRPRDSSQARATPSPLLVRKDADRSWSGR